MFGLGLVEILVIVIVGLIFIGPDNLPKVASTLGRLFFELRGLSDELRVEFNRNFYKHMQNQGPDSKEDIPGSVAVYPPTSSKKPNENSNEKSDTTNESNKFKRHTPEPQKIREARNAEKIKPDTASTKTPSEKLPPPDKAGEAPPPLPKSAKHRKLSSGDATQRIDCPETHDPANVDTTPIQTDLEFVKNGTPTSLETVEENPSEKGETTNNKEQP